MIPIIEILVGLALLSLGRRLYWLFVGCIGFAAGFYYAPLLWSIRPGVLLLLLAVAGGIVGAVLALFFQKIAVGVAGFAAGSYIAVNLCKLFGLNIGPFIWLPYFIGGAVGILLLLVLFDWALILLSSFAGASLIVQVAPLRPSLNFGVLVALAIAGILIQTVLFIKNPPVHGNR